MSFDEESDQESIDKFIQNAQLIANNLYEIIEWIPYNRLEYIKQIVKDGLGTIHLAEWIDGPIQEWDIGNEQWKRYGQRKVALKKFDNFANLNEDFLNKMTILLRARKVKHMNAIQSYDPNILRTIHELDILHQDLHPGNILSNESADVYSFGIIAYEIITDLAIKICNGLRPKISSDVSKLFTRIIIRCWDARITHRPTFLELCQELHKYCYYSGYYGKDSYLYTRTKEVVGFSASTVHSQAIYTKLVKSMNDLSTSDSEMDTSNF
ncbi:hypothetical protein Glove_440g4 [Diversispora epigaea]|uniref:Protein kinase domain-containing protein n=1 Tax=Diversispora epigaea TaxID=1348612 RepID=A0A397GX55_9GLOM|nr:hypothetical protein Glove_440g4 [Diversispora epigaea]